MYKESYFSPNRFGEAIRRLAHDLDHCERKPHRRDDVLTEGSLLLVIDMQHYFLNPQSHAFVPSAPAIVPHVLTLIKAFRTRSLPILFTRHGNLPDETGAMARWWGRILERGTELWALEGRIGANALPSEIIDKSHYDAFWGTDLQERLRALSVSELQICGVMTHLCCETTARSAFVRDFDLVMVADATATYNYELHLGSLRSLAHGFARIGWTAEYPV